MPPEDTPEQMVPKARLDAKIAEIADLRGQMKALKDAGDPSALLAQLEAEREAHAATKTAGEEALAALEVKTGEALAFAEHGITDPEDQDLVRYRRSRIEGDAPALGDYLGEAARSDRYLSHLFKADAPPASTPPVADAPPAEAPPGTTAPPVQPVADNRGAAPAPEQTTGRMAELMSMSQEQYEQNPQGFLKELLGGPG